MAEIHGTSLTSADSLPWSSPSPPPRIVGALRLIATRANYISGTSHRRMCKEPEFGIPDPPFYGLNLLLDKLVQDEKKVPAVNISVSRERVIST